MDLTARQSGHCHVLLLPLPNATARQPDPMQMHSTLYRSINTASSSNNNNRARKASRHCCCCFFFSWPEMHVLCDRCDSEAALPVAALWSPRLRAETLPALRSSDGVAPSIVKRLASDKPRQALPSIEVMYQVPLKSARLYNT